MNTNCPVCDDKIEMEKDIIESEIIECEGCHRKLVVKSLSKGKISLEEAPKVEEDCGE